ncbi:uncharacterized protein RHOBADRAFT_46692 [Rhodotorula graminis WP1]|uniref:CFEM domain-containing protein n=1 Tax=Rhodotorula graminis (strain WP1) TaxID=578459 RepID=A0A0P9GZ34_RHOGW|nr:uncharacterized protein RHOBADRAFT_46692 [Rhodotorula graminis WP1]KPV72648.1 hypothetical protein RHOBADRAFT_46692 [Rhodotorula graminis WP1]
MLVAPLAALVALAGLTLAQSDSAGSQTSSAAVPVSTAAVPGCALTCVLSTLPSSPCAAYGVGNLTCICTSSEFQLAYYQCQQSTCSETDLNAAEQYGAQSCESNGTPINIDTTPSGFSSGASSTPASSAASSASSVAASAASSISSAASPAGSSGGANPSASASGSAPAASASGSSDAGRAVLGGAVGALAAVAGLVILA